MALAPATPPVEIMPPETAARIEAAKPVLVTIKLLKNYRPEGEYEIVGHTRPEIKRKNAAGKDVVVEEAIWIEGQPAPPAQPGTGFKDKLWASTVIRIGKDEAKYMRQNLIGEVEIE